MDEEEAGMSNSYMSVDNWKRQVTVHDPAHSLGLTTPSQRKAGAPPPKLFVFDNVLTADDSLVRHTHISYDVTMRL